MFSASNSLTWAGVGLPDSRSFRKGCIVIPPILCSATLVHSLLRQLCATLLRDHVRGVPAGPVIVVNTGALFMLAMGCRRTAEGACHVVHRAEPHLCRIDAPC